MLSLVSIFTARIVAILSEQSIIIVTNVGKKNLSARFSEFFSTLNVIFRSFSHINKIIQPILI